MRISRLDLLRYGKFTDRSVSLPYSDQDFHLIIGPNEAGKSTLRNAILDLLFGIEIRSAYNFLHPHSEMRLGALIEHAGQKLDFYRIKARKQSLFDEKNTALKQDVLAEFLGATNRIFFDQMFGLNHERLVSGGNEILHAANDVGQILFQAAAGIGSLGKIRDALEAEADRLWARRRSGERAYYMASDMLKEAENELKQTIVRTKDWEEARTNVTQWKQALEQSRQQYRALETERIQLERIRRVAPALIALQEQTFELTKLGEVIALPVDSAKQLSTMELELIKANQEHVFHINHLDKIQRQLKSTRLDANLLKYEADIQVLAERWQQIRHHKTNIIKRRQEIKSHWQHIETLIRQLGWKIEEEANESQIASRLPALPVRTAILNLLKHYDVLKQAQQTSEQAVRDKLNDIEWLDKQIASLPGTHDLTDLRVALTAARALGDVRTLTKRLEAQLSKANRAFEAAQIGLGQWRLNIETLRQLTFPSTKRIASLQKRQIHYESSAATLLERRAEINGSIQEQKLDVAQYRKMHQLVTAEELAAARDARDAVWLFIKSESVSLSEATTNFEAKVCDADMIADKRYDKAQEAGTLQSKLDHLQRLQQQKKDLQTRIDTNQLALQAIQNEWTTTTKEAGLPTIPLLDIEAWLQASKQVLQVFDMVTDAKQALETLKQDEAETKSALLNCCISENGIKGEASLSLPMLMVIATDRIEHAVKTQTRLEELVKQREAAKVIKITLEQKAFAAQAALDVWKMTWRKNLALAELKVEAEPGTVEGALQCFNEIEDKLQRINTLQKEQIETMQTDLSDFEQAATTLMLNAAPDLKQASPVLVVAVLATRLEQAKTEQKEHARLSHEIAAFETKLRAIQSRINNAQAEIQSLQKLASAATINELRAAIQRSNNWRSLNDAMSITKKALLEGGDGLTQAQLDAEFQSMDVSKIPIILSELATQREAILQKQTTCSANLATANAALARIAGQDEAARAESKRQDALAKMAQAAERYIKVYTSARLLRWAIDRYRETKQGPMLAHASKIFSVLTLGSFKKLVVDFDSQPLTLDGQRTDGGIVGIPGMSDGTRDQLYFALRLAALELHLEQAQQLPFIADDLFINYDDARAKAGLEVLAHLAEKTQIIFLSHHNHLVPVVQAVLGKQVNIVSL